MNTYSISNLDLISLIMLSLVQRTLAILRRMLGSILKVLPPTLGNWETTMDIIVHSVVSVQFAIPMSFDGDTATASEATGFVVDAEKGYVLTNRHVVGPGPSYGYLQFHGHEDVDFMLAYLDPVHDFAILKYDPNALKHATPVALTLSPTRAAVGTQIRVVGNDAGETLSILSGTISRLHRNAPKYYRGYYDLNTFYHQASAGAVGGSSGSPVINIHGHAVAMQAGMRSDDASTDYFLPLDRPLRALTCLQRGETITRGDLRCLFTAKPFNECRRLGLAPDYEARMRAAFPTVTGLLVVEMSLPNGPSFGKLEEGDVLIKVGDELITHFTRLDEILDAAVGEMVAVHVQRNGEDKQVRIEVQDLHEATPDQFISSAQTVFHALTYHQAWRYGVPCEGVQLEGPSPCTPCRVVQALDDQEVPDLDSLIRALKAIPDKKQVMVKYVELHRPDTQMVFCMPISWHWGGLRLGQRNNSTGLWDYTSWKPLPAVQLTPRTATFVQLEHTPNPRVAAVIQSFVHIRCHAPVALDGCPFSRSDAMGLVIDAEKGLVIVSRAVVPHGLCDISVTFGSVELEGKVVFLHPHQNYALVQYDPTRVHGPVSSAKLSPREFQQGASTYFIGYTGNRFVHTSTTVTEVGSWKLSANNAAPRYRALNLEAITIDANIGNQCGSGVLVAPDGAVEGLWLTYFGAGPDRFYRGLAIQRVLPVISRLMQGTFPKVYVLPVDFAPIPLIMARRMGVSEEWIKRVPLTNTSHHHLLRACKRSFNHGTQNYDVLLDNDILLKIDDELITKFSDLDVIHTKQSISAVIVRQGQEIDVRLHTVLAEDLETDHAVSFCGAILQRPHPAVYQANRKPATNVYVSNIRDGSPAQQHGLQEAMIITQVNGKPIKELADLLASVAEIPGNEYFRLKCQLLSGVSVMVTMRKQQHYFPTVEWIRSGSIMSGWEWRRLIHQDGGIVDDDVAVAHLGWP